MRERLSTSAAGLRCCSCGCQQPAVDRLARSPKSSLPRAPNQPPASNEYGQCAPSDRRDILAPVRCLNGLRVRQVACGGMHSLALTEDGQIWCFGEPWGDFSMHLDRRPRRIDASEWFVDVSCGAFHNLALNEAGCVCVH